MSIVKVFTDDGEEVWVAAGIMAYDVRNLQCPGNTTGSGLAAGIRRALEDAEVIQAGGDPERPSEKAMRLSQERHALPVEAETPVAS